MYNAMGLKNYQEEANEKESSAFLPNRKWEKEQNKPTEKYPSLISGLPREAEPKESLKTRCARYRCLNAEFLLTQLIYM